MIGLDGFNPLKPNRFLITSPLGDYIPARTCHDLHPLNRLFPPADAAGLGNAIQLLLLPVSNRHSAVPLGYPRFLSSVFTLSLLLPPCPGKGKINLSCNQFTTQTDYSPSPLSCSPRQGGHLHRALPKADFGHGKCQVRHGEL